jgi:REP element-mobilizing transposase RayT
MSAPKYNPQRHNRRSIRLKGHDYAGGGTYFVTICAHHTAGDIFAPDDVKNMIADVWREMPNTPVGAPLVGALFTNATMGTHKGCPYVVMPDHFHAMVYMQPGKTALGNIIGAFKSLVVHEYIKGVEAGHFAPFPGKIWQRNYYEMIVRTPEMEQNIRQYIRMNPWRLVQHAKLDGQSYRMLLMEMRNKEGNLAAAKDRNHFVLNCTDNHWIPHVTSGGMLDRLLQETTQNSKPEAIAL